MSIWTQIKQASRTLWRGGTSKGQTILVNAMGIWNGMLGLWSANRYEQVRHNNGWNYIGTKVVCEAFAMEEPSIGYVLSPEEATHQRRSLGRILTKELRRKAIANIQDHEEIELVDSDHLLYRLFHQPNPVDTGYELLYELIMYLEICGNSYVWKVRDVLGTVRELWVLPADWIRPKANSLDGSMPNKFIEYYECNPRGFLTSAGHLDIPAKDLIWFKYKNPRNKFDGLSPSQAGSPWIDVAESLDISQYASFKNRSVTDLVIELDGKYADPGKAGADRIREEYSAKQSGEMNVRLPLVGTPGATFKNLSPSPVEMDYVQSAAMIRDNCLALRRVSKMNAGLDEASSYNNMITSRAAFSHGTMKPKYMMVGQKFTEELARELDDRLIIFWPDATPEDPVQVLAERVAMSAAGVMPPNQWRREMGWEPYPHGGDDPMVNGQVQGWVSGKQPLDLAALMGQAGAGQKPGLPGTKEEQDEGSAGAVKFWLGHVDGAPMAEPVRRRHRSKGWNESDHPRGQPDNAGQFGSGGGGAQKPAKQRGDIATREYVEAFNDLDNYENDQQMREDVNNANQDLWKQDSKFRVVPDGEGGWKAMTDAEVRSEYDLGEDYWLVRQNMNADWVVMTEDQSNAPYPDSDQLSDEYADEFNNDPGEISPFRVNEVNEHLAEEGSEYRVWPNPETERWEPIPLESLVGEHGETWSIRHGDNGWEVTDKATKSLSRLKTKDRRRPKPNRLTLAQLQKQLTATNGHARV